MQSLQDDFLGRAFSFKFVETTTSQVKKQYDGFIQYRSNSIKCIVILYCGSLFVDHCPFETLVEHFFKFIKKKQYGYKLFAAYWYGWSKYKPKISKTVSEC